MDKQFKNIRAQQEIRTTIKAVQNTGSEVEYIEADVTNKASLEEKLQKSVQRLGKISGIIHGAGNLADRRIEKKTLRDFETVFYPKVDGLQNLLEIVPVSQLDLLVSFSSVVGFFGNMGQADYAMANEVMNKAAYQLKRENPGCRVISINWGPWDSGMVTPELKRAFASRNMDVIPVEAGADRLVTEVYAKTPPQDHPVQLIIGSLPTRPAATFDPSLKR